MPQWPTRAGHGAELHLTMTPDWVLRGDETTMTIDVTNTGDRATGANGELSITTPAGILAEPATVTFGQILPGATARIHLLLTVWAHLEYGDYPLTLLARQGKAENVATVPLTVTSRQNLPNVAVGKPSTQSSTAFDGPARLANDGNTNGNFPSGSVTHTGFDVNAWWEVDLEQTYHIAEIAVWNRLDNPTRTADFHVLLSETPLPTDLAAALQHPGVWQVHHPGQADFPSTFPTEGASGRYVRVQLAGTNYLTLAEVQVLVPPSATGT